MKVTDKYIFFYGGIFSQWHLCDIVIDNIKYCTCEQYMMIKKAELFDDNYALGQIMSSSDPAAQKSWGRRVKNFDQNKWEKIARKVVFDANYAKFTQHDNLKQQLMDSGDKVIVEASPTDCIWGVGLRATSSKILDSKNWRGTNWLGEAIMKVRTVLKDLENG